VRLVHHTNVLMAKGASWYLRNHHRPPGVVFSAPRQRGPLQLAAGSAASLCSSDRRHRRREL